MMLYDFGLNFLFAAFSFFLLNLATSRAVNVDGLDFPVAPSRDFLERLGESTSLRDWARPKIEDPFVVCFSFIEIALTAAFLALVSALVATADLKFPCTIFNA